MFKQNNYKMRKSILVFSKVYLVIVILCCLLCLCLVGCTKTVDLHEGTFAANEIYVNDNLNIDRLEFNIEKVSNDDNSSNVFLSNGEKLKLNISLILNGENKTIKDTSITYYGHKMRVAFIMDEKEIFLTGIMKQNGKSTYIDASLKIGNEGIDLKLTESGR